MPDGAELLEVDEDDSSAEVSVDDDDRPLSAMPTTPTTPKTFRERKKEKVWRCNHLTCLMLWWFIYNYIILIYTNNVSNLYLVLHGFYKYRYVTHISSFPWTNCKCGWILLTVMHTYTLWTGRLLKKNRPWFDYWSANLRSQLSRMCNWSYFSSVLAKHFWWKIEANHRWEEI